MTRLMATAAAVALTMSALTASAEPTAPQASVPSAQNSGAGIAGFPGNKNGPATQPGTFGMGAATYNLAVAAQDSANVQGLPGGKSGPPAERWTGRGGL
jgi:hypothetical protein